MKINPTIELTAQQLSELSESDMFKYLDARAKYLRQFTAPALPPRTQKMYNALNKQLIRK